MAYKFGKDRLARDYTDAVATPKTVEQVAQALGVTEARAEKSLAILAAMGIVDRLDNGTYQRHEGVE